MGLYSPPAAAGGTPKNIKNWAVHDTFTTSREYSNINTGSGSVTAVGGGFGANTGGTAGSRGGMYGNWTNSNPPVESINDSNPDFVAVCELANNTSTGFVSYILDQSSSTAPTQGTGAYTSEHMGFLLDTTVLYATNANGSQTTTDISSGVTVTANNTYRCVAASGTNIKFYVNKTLKATHTTNLPSGATNSTGPMFGIQNDAGVTTTRNAYYGGSRIAWDAE